MNAKLTAERLGRRAIVYIRQSSAGQVAHNQESRRRQYALADQARCWRPDAERRPPPGARRRSQK